MVAAQRHRGPEDDGVFVGQAGEGHYVALGHNRLSIIDLSDAATQPMVSDDNRHALVLNGFVSNWRELAAELPGHDLERRSRGDTAVVFAALRLWGPEALKRFNGMWAIAYFDATRRTLLISRDRLGIKPLYFHQTGSDLLIASEAKAILEASRARFGINADAAVTFLSRGLVDVSSASMFRGIHSFPAASWAEVDVCADVPRVEPKRYWQHPHERGEPVQRRASAAELREVFCDSVARTLRSDVPVGLLLSGGLDSSAIAGAAAAAGHLLPTVSMVWEPRASTEEKFIDAVTRKFGLPSIKVNVSTHPLDLLDRLPDATWHNDGPIAAIEEVARLPLMEAARAQGIKVMLCGQGGDEQLGGYRKSFFFWLRELLRRGHFVAAATLVAQTSYHSRVLSEFQLTEALRYAGGGWLTRHSFVGAAHQSRDTVDLGFGESYPAREWADLSRLSLPTLLHSEDRMSMARAIEMRVPFLDHQLVECLAHIHPSDKFRGGWTKGIFREAVHDLLPAEVRYRRDKNGFVWPVDQWVRGAFRPRIEEMIKTPMRAAALGLLDQGAFRTAYARFCGGQGHINGRHILRAFAFEAFLVRFDQFINFAAPPSPAEGESLHGQLVAQPFWRRGPSRPADNAGN